MNLDRVIEVASFAKLNDGTGPLPTGEPPHTAAGRGGVRG